MQKNFYIFRHGETEWNRLRLIQGRADMPLNETGRQQAQALIPVLREKNIELIASSTLKRAVESAEIINAELQVPCVRDERLQELNCGEFDGRSVVEIKEQYGQEALLRFLTSSTGEDLNSCFPGGELKKDAQVRAVEALTDLALGHTVCNFAVAAHGIIIMLLAGYAGCKAYFPLANGDMIHLVYHSKEGDVKGGLWHFAGRIPGTRGGIPMGA